MWIKRVQKWAGLLAPFILVLAYWFEGEHAFLACALLITIALVFLAVISRKPVTRPTSQSQIGADAFIQILTNRLNTRQVTDVECICVMLEIDEYSGLKQKLGNQQVLVLQAEIAHRLKSRVRGLDCLTAVGDTQFALAIILTQKSSTDAQIELADRIQTALSEKFEIADGHHYITCSLGYTVSGVRANAEQLAHNANLALSEAKRNGPSAVRAYSTSMQNRHVGPYTFSAEDLFSALAQEEIQPWFQPQISTDTGEISGFEALARWVRPDGSVLAPNEFLPELEAVGLMEHLGQAMFLGALKALKQWDSAGFEVASVGVNLSTSELQNPKLADMIAWELDRFDVAPERVSFEILETVVAETDEDVIVRTIARLARLGCLIDLDDFGTGHASITSIRRFAVHRLKIDRSFVTRCDQDQQQRQLLEAILSMADRLGLKTLAEGVETRAEHAMLARLGCGYAQGFSIGHPMSFDQTIDWLTQQRRKRDANLSLPKSGG